MVHAKSARAIDMDFFVSWNVLKTVFLISMKVVAIRYLENVLAAKMAFWETFVVLETVLNVQVKQNVQNAQKDSPGPPVIKIVPLMAALSVI